MSSRPQLAGHLARTTRIGVVASVAVGLFFGGGYALFVRSPRKKAYEEFYKNYDEEKEWEHLRKTNLLKSVDRNGKPRKSMYE